MSYHSNRSALLALLLVLPATLAAAKSATFFTCANGKKLAVSSNSDAIPAKNGPITCSSLYPRGQLLKLDVNGTALKCLASLFSQHQHLLQRKWNIFLISSIVNSRTGVYDANINNYFTPFFRFRALPFVCEYSCPPGYQYLEEFGKCAKLYSERRNWKQAEKTCNADGGHLYSIGSRKEYTKFVGLLDKNAHVWIGLNDNAKESTFVWTSGIQNGYIKWGQYEPNGWYTENCVFYVRDQYVDGKCNLHHQFVCEIGNTQTIAECKSFGVNIVTPNFRHFGNVATHDKALVACRAIQASLPETSIAGHMKCVKRVMRGWGIAHVFVLDVKPNAVYFHNRVTSSKSRHHILCAKRI